MLHFILEMSKPYRIPERKDAVKWPAVLAINVERLEYQPSVSQKDQYDLQDLVRSAATWKLAIDPNVPTSDELARFLQLAKARFDAPLTAKMCCAIYEGCEGICCGCIS